VARIDTLAGPEVGVSMDKWSAYEFERRRFLKHLHDARVANPVVITGDVHHNSANELIADFDRLDSRSVATEFVGTSIASGGDGEDQPERLKTLLSENPFVKFQNYQRGYVRCEVTPKSWRTDFRTIPFITKPNAPITTRATFVVESGRPVLNKA
jgi:alkaline phosphatase D